jgi:hypothetical protein
MEPLREVGKLGRDWCPRVFAEDAGALRGDVGNRVVIARDERPCRQLIVEPSHARFGMSARDVSGFRDLSATPLPEGRKIYEMIRDRPKQFELHPPRVEAPGGRVAFSNRFVIHDSGEPHETAPDAEMTPIADLPDYALLFLLQSRY